MKILTKILLFALCALTLRAQYSGSGSGSGGAGGQYSGAAAVYSIGTVFLPPGGGLANSATETNVQGKVGVAGTISNFTVNLSAAVGASSTAIFTWRKNTTDQAVTCTLTGTGAGGTTCSDTTHNFTVAVGDLIDIKVVVSGANTASVAVVMTWGLPGVAGPAGSAGPAPSGTGIVNVSGGVLQANLPFATTGAANTIPESGAGGKLDPTWLPNPSASALGGVESIVAATHQWINSISTSGVPSQTQPAFTDISGTLATAQQGGTAGGDLSGTFPNPTVAQVNGAAVPASAPVLGSNSSHQLTNVATTIAQKYFGTAAPGSVAGNLPGDFFTDTTNHNEYVCNAPSGTAAPACTSVATAGWLLVNGGGAGTGAVFHALGSISGAVTQTATSNVADVYTATLTGNVTSFTLTGMTSGEQIVFAFTQDATGFRSVTWPSGFSNVFPPAYALANAVIVETFVWNGSSANLMGVTINGTSVGVEAAAPSGNPASGSMYAWYDSTDHQFETKNSSGTVSKLGGSGVSVSGYYTTIGGSTYCGFPLQVCTPASGLTILNTAGSSAINTTGGTQVLQSHATGTNNVVMAGGAISGSNTTGIIAVSCFQFPGTGQSGSPASNCGAALRESSTGKMLVIEIGGTATATAGSIGLSVNSWTNQTTYNTNVSPAATVPPTNPWWVKFTCSVAGCQSGTLTLQASQDGINFSAGIAARAVTTDFTTGPNQFGVIGNPLSTSDDMFVPILSYTVQ